MHGHTNVKLHLFSHTVLVFVSFVISTLLCNYIWPAILHLFCHLRYCIFKFSPSVLSLLSFFLSFFLCFNLTLQFSVWGLFKIVSKLRRKVNVRVLLLWTNKKRNSDKQAATEGYVMGVFYVFNTLRTGDANLRFYITTVQDGWRKSAFLTHACFPCTVHLTFRHRASCILGQAFHYSP